MIEFALSQYLQTRTPVTDIVSTRIYADVAPQGKPLPYIVYEQSGGTRHYHTEGASGLVEASITLTFHAATPEKARLLYEVVRDEIDGYAGLWGDDSVVVDRAALTPFRSARAAPTQGDEVGHPAVEADLDVFYQESIPALGVP